MSIAKMKIHYSLAIVAILSIDVSSALHKSTPVAIPIKRSYSDSASYQLTGAQANQLHRAMKSLQESHSDRAGYDAKSTEEPVKLLWIPVPLKEHDSHHKTLPLLPIPISNQIANSESPFKIVIVESEKGKGLVKNEHSIEEIEKIISEVQPTSHQQSNTGGQGQFQQHTVQLQPIEQSRPEYRDNSYHQIRNSGNGKHEASAVSGNADGVNYRSKETKPSKLQLLADDYSKATQKPQLDDGNSGGGRTYDGKNQATAANYDTVEKPVGRTYGSDESKSIEGNGYGLKHHSAGSYVHVEVNSYGGQSQKQREQNDHRASEMEGYGRTQQDSSYTSYGVSDVPAITYGAKRPKAVGKAQIHVTVMENDDREHHPDGGGYGSYDQRQIFPESQGDGYGVREEISSTGSYGNHMSTATEGDRNEEYGDNISGNGYGSASSSPGGKGDLNYGDHKTTAYSFGQSQSQASGDYGRQSESTSSNNYASASTTGIYGAPGESAVEIYGDRGTSSGGRHEESVGEGYYGKGIAKPVMKPAPEPYRPVLESYSHQEHTQTVHHGGKYRLPPVLPVETPPNYKSQMPSPNYIPESRPETQNYGPPPPPPKTEEHTYGPPPQPHYQYDGPQPRPESQNYDLPPKSESLMYGARPKPELPSYGPSVKPEPSTYGPITRPVQESYISSSEGGPRNYGQPVKYEEPVSYGPPPKVEMPGLRPQLLPSIYESNSQVENYGSPMQSSSYGPAVEVETPGYDSPVHPVDLGPPSEPLTFIARPPEQSSSRPVYGMDDEELDEPPPKPPCEEPQSGGYIPPPSLPISGHQEFFQIANHEAQEDFGKYQGGIQEHVSSGDNYEHFQTETNGNYGSEGEYVHGEGTQSNDNYGYDKSAKKGKPFYIVIFQKQKVQQPESSQSNSYPESYH